MGEKKKIKVILNLSIKMMSASSTSENTADLQNLLVGIAAKSSVMYTVITIR